MARVYQLSRGPINSGHLDSVFRAAWRTGFLRARRKALRPSLAEHCPGLQECVM